MNIRFFLATFVAFFLFIPFGNNQNLIPNPGFEKVEKCPDGLKQLERAAFWQAANAGSPELFHACGFEASINPYEGDGMAGLILLSDYDNSVEYLQIELKEKLKKGANYCFKYQIILDRNAAFAINMMGVHFSNERLYSPNWQPFRNFPQLKSEEIIDHQNEWTEMEYSYTAKGGEQFMTFGNFYERHFLSEKIMSNNLRDWVTYYYVDNFELYEAAEGCRQYSKVKLPFSEAKVIWKHTVYFEVDQFNISARQKDSLLQFINQLPPNITQSIKVVGHTDTDSGIAYNLELSKKRTLAVDDFLKENGIANTWLNWSGEQQPVNKELTEDGKALNRRVELIISKP